MSKQVWRERDLVACDNRCVMDRREAFDPAVVRLMHRTAVAGHPPISAAAG